MRTLRILALIISAVVLVGSGVLFFTSKGKNDAPSITCSEDSAIIATVNTPDEELLKYVTAYDNQDGNLTDRIKVIRKNNFLSSSEKSTLITFSVCDSDNNVSSISRKLILSDYHSPKFSLSYDFIFPSGYTYDLKKYVTADDVLDGNLTKYVKLIATDFTNTTGEYSANLKVSNSMADTSEINFNIIVTDKDWFDIKVRLNDYAVYTTVGQKVDYLSLIKEISYKDKNHKHYDTDDLTIDDSAVNYLEPGTYNVFYSIIDGETTVTKTRLLLIVTEG